MKNYLVIGLILSSLLIAAPNNQTNIVSNKDKLCSVVQTTLKSNAALFDGVISSEENFSVAASTKQDQNIILKLDHPYYVREVKVFVDKNNSCNTVKVRYSKDSNIWQDLDVPLKEETDRSVVFRFDAGNVLAGYLAFIFSGGKTDTMRIQEIEVYPQIDVRLRSRHVKDSWIITDREAFDDIDTKIDTVKNWMYSEVGAPAAQRFKTRPAPVLENELLSVGGLKPGSAYEYKMSLTDYNGNILELEPRNFNTRPLSFADGKKYEGTFNTNYDGNKIAANVYPLTNGSTDIRSGLALSGAVKNADQYVLVDLGAEKNLSEVVTIWRSLGYSKDFSIQLSNDKINWSTVAEHQNAGVVTPARSVEGHPVQVMISSFPRTSARYIKLLAAKGSAVYSKHGTDVLELFELKAF